MVFWKLSSRVSREIIAEFIGSFILVTFAIGAGAQLTLSNGQMGNFLSLNIAGGLGLTFGIYFSGGVSGGHLNPAVTLGFCIMGKTAWWKWPLYSIAQLAGSFVAAAVQFGIYHDAINHFDGGIRSTYGNTSTAGIFSTFPQEFVSTTNAFFDQVFATFLFLLLGCIHAVADEKNMMPPKGIIPIAMGMIVTAIGTSFAFNCGYAINCARDFGPRLFTVIAGWGLEPISYRNYNWFWVPIVGPLVGSVIASYVYIALIQYHWPRREDEKPEVVTIHVNGKDNAAFEPESEKF
ncbi:aquaporin-10-like [Mytilus californianus]|uniref:aquaporin-10-like n=1 Tax=Mytilus californianus TaxID=6549 RepID=UPI002246662F|nr:aquaporin-10-like [Mytilus californianus]